MRPHASHSPGPLFPIPFPRPSHRLVRPVTHFRNQEDRWIERLSQWYAVGVDQLPSRIKAAGDPVGDRPAVIVHRPPDHCPGRPARPPAGGYRP